MRIAAIVNFDKRLKQLLKVVKKTLILTILKNNNDERYDCAWKHQTDTACAWLVCHSQEGLCKLYPPYPASPEDRAPI